MSNKISINPLPILITLAATCFLCGVVVALSNDINRRQEIIKSAKYKKDDDVSLRLFNINAVILDYRIINGNLQYKIKYVNPKDGDIEEEYVEESELKLLSK